MLDYLFGFNARLGRLHFFLATIALAVAATLNLQAMRLRDIGWDPICVIVGWIAIEIIDGIIAMKVPSLSLGPGHHGTVLASIVNLVMGGLLLFWPSSDA